MEICQSGWPKLTVSDYPEMLRKLSTAAFLVTIACISFLRSQVPPIDEYLGRLDVTPNVGVYSIPVPLGTLLVAVIVAVLSESTKLHDKISRALGTRAVFDVRWILLPMALLSGAAIDRRRFDRFSTDRRRLMNEVFYKYASSAKTADIDGHLITQALTAWSWYWMCVEALVILTFTSLVLAWFAKWGATALILAIMFALLLLIRTFRAEATNYAEAEVSEILEDGKRRRAVKSVFDAL